MLVVDDEEVFRDLLMQFFTLRGWQVSIAEDAESGIRAYRRHHPQAVIMDVHLGGGRDGVSLCEQIRDDISSLRTAILIVSADCRTAKDQLRGHAAGADAYMIKPVLLTVLEERLKEALRDRMAR